MFCSHMIIACSVFLCCLDNLQCTRYVKDNLPLFVDIEDDFIRSENVEKDIHCARLCEHTEKCSSFIMSSKVCTEGDIQDYIGTFSMTLSGRICQAWNSQYPHKHGFSVEYFPDSSLTKARNYCRDPDMSGYLWCYTTDPDQKWEPCDIFKCNEYVDELCLQDGDIANYVGKVDVTTDGTKCQDWTEDTVHYNNYTDDSLYPGGNKTASANYCRDPSNAGYLWCFTVEPTDRWMPCAVESCEDVIPLQRCYEHSSHTNYTGTWSKTVTGIPCQRWDSQTPHSHHFTGDNSFPDASITDAANYCRDPDGSGYLWCYASTDTVSWEPCGLNKCLTHIPCRHSSDTIDYSGTWSQTYSGKTCQHWNQQSPHTHTFTEPNFNPPDNNVDASSNYCRDPDQSGDLWCFTTDADVGKESCDISRCHNDTNNCRLYSAAVSSMGTSNTRAGFQYYRKQNN